MVPGGFFEGDSVFFLRVRDAEFLPTGEAAVVLGSERLIAVLDSAGHTVRAFGGAGEGPDQFRGVPDLIRTGRDIGAVEPVRLRYRNLSAERLGDGDVREISPGHRLVGVFGDGSIVSVNAPEPLATAQPRATMPYYVQQGAVVDTLTGPASPPALGSIRTVEPNRTIVVRMIPQANLCLPELLYAMGDSVLVIADGGTGTITALSRSGDVDTLYQGRGREIVPAGMVAGAEQFTSDMELPTEYRQALLEALGRPGDPLPAVWSASLWDGRYLWLRRGRPCFLQEDAPPAFVWDVIDVSTRLNVGFIEVPASLRPLAVADDRLLVATIDELGVERVGLYRILRQASGT